MMTVGTRCPARILISTCIASFAIAMTCAAQTRGNHQERLPVHPYPASKNYPEPAWFVNVAPQAGLNMQNVNGEPSVKKYIIETTGSGVAFIDYAHDGWPDTLLLTGKTLDGERLPVKEKDDRPAVVVVIDNRHATAG